MGERNTQAVPMLGLAVLFDQRSGQSNQKQAHSANEQEQRRQGDSRCGVLPL